MQEEVEQKSLTLTVNAAKMTARLFRTAIAKYVAHKKEKKHDAQTGVRYVGRQSVKKLVGQNQGVSNVELSGEDIKAFERVARKYGVDYAVKKVKGDVPRFLIFFKARDADALNAALEELVGCVYKPIALLATQVVAGTNYCFLCETTVVAPDAQPSYALVYVFDGLSGEHEILRVQEIEFSAFE